MTIQEILLGKEPYFPGLIPLVDAYLEHIRCAPEVRTKVHEYLDLIESRACGTTQTTAAWIRDFVARHPDYRKDSVVTPSIAYDLVEACRDIGDGSRSVPELLGPHSRVKPVLAEDAYDVALQTTKIATDRRIELVESYFQRMSFRTMRRAVEEGRGR